MLGFTAGSDDLTSFAFSTDLSNLEVDVDGVAGDVVIWVRNSDAEIVGKIGGIDAIRLTLIAPLRIAAGPPVPAPVRVGFRRRFRIRTPTTRHFLLWFRQTAWRPHPVGPNREPP